MPPSRPNGCAAFGADAHTLEHGQKMRIADAMEVLPLTRERNRSRSPHPFARQGEFVSLPETAVFSSHRMERTACQHQCAAASDIVGMLEAFVVVRKARGLIEQYRHIVFVGRCHSFGDRLAHPVGAEA